MKKQRVDRIFIALFYQYILDFAVIAFMVIGVLGVLFFFVVKRTEYEQQLKSQQNEITQLKEKAEIIKYRNDIITDGIDLDQMSLVFAELLPEKEDYFSIISTLERLAIRSSFLINAYTVDIQKSNPNKLTLSIEGEGSPSSFVNFLRNYNFGGGRLITIDSIEFTTEGGSKITLSVNFYSGSGTTATAATNLSNEDKKLLEEIQSKVSYQLQPDESVQQQAVEYETKENPF